MADFNKIKLYLKIIHNKYKHKKYSNNINDEHINYLKQLNLNNNEKYYFLNLMIFYRIDNQIFNKICSYLYNDINLLKYSGFLNDIIHNYLYDKILNYDFNLEDFIQQKEQQINQPLKQIIKDELIKINTFIDDNNYLNKIYNSCEIDKNVIFNIHNIGYDYEILTVKSKGHYQLSQTKYYDENFNMYSYFKFNKWCFSTIY